MLTPILMCVLMSQVVIAQLNGEFWWLNGRLAREQKIRAPLPKFEKLSEHDTDESDKVIFRDNDLFIFHTHGYKKGHGKSDKEKPGNPSNVVRPSHNLIDNTTQNKTNDNVNKTYYDNHREVIVFKIPIINNETTKVTPTNMPVIDKLVDESLSQNICTFMKKNDCYRSNGLIHQQYGKYPTKSPFEFQFICCILPLSEPKNIDSGKIYFPDTPRRKRSNTEEISVALQQRNVLLQRKYSAHRVKPAASVTRVVTDDYNDPDPYWNIKNKHVNNPNKILKNAQLDYDDNNNQEYSTELPKPGLVGLYSDQARPSSAFSFLGENPSPYGGMDDYDEEEEVPTFGYSTIDPRLGDRKTKRHRSPLKLTSTTQQSSSDEITNNAESHTISYQSSPDFQVLHGFKLLNLFRNRSIITSKNKKTINRNYGNDDSTDYVITKPLEANSEPDGFSDVDDERQLFEGCGIADETMNYEEGKQIGSAEEGSHPWLALVVRTKRKQDILCYATLIHPRAALTSADCVYGSFSNDVTLIAGLWDLNDKSRSSHRAASIHLHAQYKPGSLANDLALLHWMQPLKLGASIQPACLANPDSEENCFLFGWGGFDQAIRMRSRWQKATILSHRKCIGQVSSRNGNEIPANAFCASVRSRGTVTGIGGPLICQNDGRQSTVGVAVWRDNVVVLLPAKEWALRAAEVINSD